MKLGIRSWIGSCSLLALLYVSDARAADYMSNTEGANHLGRSSQVSSSYRSIDASSREENNANERQRAITNDEKEQLKKLFYADDFDLKRVENFLKDKGIDFSLNKAKGSEEITLAAELENPDLVRLLMNYGADINAKYPLLKGSPLHTAVVFLRNRGAMRCLVECGADVKNCNQENGSLVESMIQHWSNGFGEEDIEFMVKHGMDVNQMYNSRGNIEVPLIWAIELNKGEDLIKCLIDNGADINKADSKGNTPLMVASSNGCFETVRLLLSMENVDINARNKKGKTALDFAQEKSDWAQKELKEKLDSERNSRNVSQKTLKYLKRMNESKGYQKNLKDKINQKNKEIERIKETIEGIEKTYDILLRHGAKTKEKINLELRDIYFNDAVSILS